MFILLLTVLIALTGCTLDNHIFNATTGEDSSIAQTSISGTYQNVVEAFDWGPAVTKLIIHLDQPITGDNTGDLDETAFLVETTKNGNIDATEIRVITNVYTCDSTGNLLDMPSEYIAIEMNVTPTVGSLFFYNTDTSLNEWCTSYEQSITLVKELTSGDKTITHLDILPSDDPWFIVSTQPFKTNVYTYGTDKDTKTLHYAYYEIDNASDNGLVIWLHASSEAGTDPMIALLGNKVTYLASEDIQNALGGCDILVPQCPNRWFPYQTGVGKDTINTQDMYESDYTQALKGLIESYLSAHPSIDINRIYIGGASDGGSMAMNMILNYPDYFAAAFFASEGYADRYITDEQIHDIKHLPMWFVYAADDVINEPVKTSQATYERLIRASARDVRSTNYIDGVFDTSGVFTADDGSPYQYNDHWSWIYVLNNICVDDNLSIMEWIGRQYK